MGLQKPKAEGLTEGGGLEGPGAEAPTCSPPAWGRGKQEESVFLTEGFQKASLSGIFRLPWSLSQPHLPQIILPHPSACVHSQTLLGAREQGPVFICKETAIEEWNFSLSSCVSGKPSSSPPQPHRTIWVQVSGPGGGLPRKSLSFLRHPCPHGYQAPLPEAHPLQAKRTTQICPGSWARPCRAGLPR